MHLTKAGVAPLDISKSAELPARGRLHDTQCQITILSGLEELFEAEILFSSFEDHAHMLVADNHSFFDLLNKVFELLIIFCDSLLLHLLQINILV